MSGLPVPGIGLGGQGYCRADCNNDRGRRRQEASARFAPKDHEDRCRIPIVDFQDRLALRRQAAANRKI